MENKPARVSIKSRITKNGKRMFDSDEPEGPPMKKVASNGRPTEKFIRPIFKVPANAYTMVRSALAQESNSRWQGTRNSMVKAIRFNVDVTDTEKRWNSMIHSVLGDYNPTNYDELLERINQVLRLEALEEFFEKHGDTEENVADFLRILEEETEKKKFFKNIEELREFVEARNFLFAQGGDDQVARNTSFAYRKGILSMTNYLKDKNSCSLDELLTFITTDTESFPVFVNDEYEKIFEDTNFFLFKLGQQGNLVKCDSEGNEFNMDELKKLLLKHPQIFTMTEELVSLTKGVKETPSFWVSSALPDSPKVGTRDYSRIEDLQCEIFVLQDYYALAKVMEGPFTGQSVYILPLMIFKENTDLRTIFKTEDQAVIKCCTTMNFKHLFAASQLVSHSREGEQLTHEGMRRMRHTNEPNIYDDLNEYGLRKTYRVELRKIRFMDRLLSGKFVPPTDLPFVKMSNLKYFVQTRAGLFYFEKEVPRCRDWNYRRKFLNLVDGAYDSKKSFKNRTSAAGIFSEKEMQALLDHYRLLNPHKPNKGVTYWIVKGSFDKSSRIYIPDR